MLRRRRPGNHYAPRQDLRPGRDRAGRSPLHPDRCGATHGLAAAGDPPRRVGLPVDRSGFARGKLAAGAPAPHAGDEPARRLRGGRCPRRDRKSTRLNSSHPVPSYAVFCLKKKQKKKVYHLPTKEKKNKKTTKK